MCAIDQQAKALGREVAFIIKWNPRTTPVETIAKAKVADASTAWVSLREGKRQCVWSAPAEVTHAGQTLRVRRVYRLTERTIDQHGQRMLLPEYTLEGWTTTLLEAQTNCGHAQMHPRTHVTSRGTSKPKAYVHRCHAAQQCAMPARPGPISAGFGAQPHTPSLGTKPALTGWPSLEER
jgi:hypothetical protein